MFSTIYINKNISLYSKTVTQYTIYIKIHSIRLLTVRKTVKKINKASNMTSVIRLPSATKQVYMTINFSYIKSIML